MEDQIWQRLRQEGKLAPVSSYDTLLGFFHAVSWENDRYLFLSLLCMQLLCLTLVWTTRRRVNVQIVLLCFLALMVYYTETVNEIGDYLYHRYKLTSQNYFDQHGVFITIFYAMPLLAIMMVQMVTALYNSSQLLVQVKRHEIRNKKAKTQ